MGLGLIQAPPPHAKINPKIPGSNSTRSAPLLGLLLSRGRTKVCPLQCGMKKVSPPLGAWRIPS